MMLTPGLGEASSKVVVRRARRSDVEARPHKWEQGRCQRCQMLAGWPGAAYPCEGSQYTARVRP